MALSSSSSKGWLSNLPSKASRIYFFLIILQIPLFRYTSYASFCLSRHHLQLNLCTFFSLPFWRSVFLSLRILVYPCFTSWDLLKILYHHVLASGYSEFLKFLCVCCWWMSARTCLDAFSWNMISVRKLVSVFCTPNKEGKIKFEAKNRKIRRF